MLILSVCIKRVSGQHFLPLSPFHPETIRRDDWSSADEGHRGKNGHLYEVGRQADLTYTVTSRY